MGPKAKYSGFYGYIVRNANKQNIYIVNKTFSKKLKVTIPSAPPYWIKNKTNLSNKLLLSTKDILNSNYVENKTFDNKKIKGVKIFGSFINGDKSKAHIKLKISNNSRLLYKTGPRTKGQQIKIYSNGKEIFNGNLVSQTNWGVIVFDISQKYTNLTIEMIDNSSKWGEWSSVGLEEKK
ncbi:hypothetical protein ACMCNP_01150 [Candidatus Acidulodesulfobacterium sp. H_13]|uniref:hypothetical protein n=1 Tax=Candidatus Acidulodesulfobacterium sp. H_13 TaxID=3395470 RepID=UPI003AF60F6A